MNSSPRDKYKKADPVTHSQGVNILSPDCPDKRALQNLHSEHFAPITARPLVLTES